VLLLLLLLLPLPLPLAQSAKLGSVVATRREFRATGCGTCVDEWRQKTWEYGEERMKKRDI
jgi:hypothetical protein